VSGPEVGTSDSRNRGAAVTDTRAMKIGPAAPPSAATPSAQGPATGAGRTFVQVLREGGVASPPAAVGPVPSTTPTRAGAAATSPLARGIARALEGATAGEARIDAILDAAAKGKTFTAGELLAMQATVFRYSQTIEVLSRATDRLVGAVKQTLGTSV
jgi:hypothetical protein